VLLSPLLLILLLSLAARAGGQQPPAPSWGTPSDIAEVVALYTNMTAWSNKRNIKVLMGEAGCQVAVSLSLFVRLYVCVVLLCFWDFVAHSEDTHAGKPCRPPEVVLDHRRDGAQHH
jgi:hypothetical protein